MKKALLISATLIVILTGVLASIPRVLLSFEAPQVSLLETAFEEYLSTASSNRNINGLSEVMIVRDKNCPPSFDPHVPETEISFVSWAEIEPPADSDWQSWPWAVHFSDIRQSGLVVTVNVYKDPAAPDGIIALMGGGKAYECRAWVGLWTCKEIGTIIR